MQSRTKVFLAVTAAGSYWLSVFLAFGYAQHVDDQFGFAFFPFILLSFPWHFVAAVIVGALPIRGLESAAYTILALGLPVINALGVGYILGGSEFVTALRRMAAAIWHIRTKGREGSA
jgi:hypothetical protein